MRGGVEASIREGGKIIYQNALDRGLSEMEAKQEQSEFVQMRLVQEDRPDEKLFIYKGR